MVYSIYVVKLTNSLILAMRYGLEDASPEVVALVSHAVQERLKTLVEKLGIIAEHRLEQLKVSSSVVCLSYLNDFISK